MIAKCRIDYGQFEANKKYDYIFKNNTGRYHVDGLYSESEFTKKQFTSIFIPINQNNLRTKNQQNF